MKQTINFSQFHDAFKDIRPDNFSYDGLRLLYDWFEDMAECCDSEPELDVIAICCDFCESDADELIEDHSIEGFREKCGSFEDWRVYGDRENEKLMQYLNEHTFVIGETEQGTIVYQAW